MAVEKIEKIVDAFSLSPKKVKEYVYRTTDGKEFVLQKDAVKYDKRYVLLQNFQQHFSEEKSNFKIGSKELNEILLVTEDNSSFEDSFWAKINDEQDMSIFEKFCLSFYKLKFIKLYKEDITYNGWIYTVVIKDGEIDGTYWASKKQLENMINVIQNNFPEKIENVIKNKKVNKFEIMDI